MRILHALLATTLLHAAVAEVVCPGYTVSNGVVTAAWGSGVGGKQTKVLESLYQMQDIVQQDCNRRSFYVYGEGVIVGAWFGSRIHPKTAVDLINTYIADAARSGSMEYCGAETPAADYRFGITVDITSNITGVLSMVTSWSKGSCSLQSVSGKVSLPSRSLYYYTGSKTAVTESSKPLSYNMRSAMYEIKDGDTCDSIRAQLSLDSTLDFYNSVTYGWMGCDALVVGQIVSVSSGAYPRMYSGNNVIDQIEWISTYSSQYSEYIPMLDIALSDIRGKVLVTDGLTNATVTVGNITAGIWLGDWIDNGGSLATIDYFSSVMRSSFGDGMLYQYMGGNADWTLGLIASIDSKQVDEAMAAWKQGRRYSKGTTRMTGIAGPIYTLIKSKSRKSSLLDISYTPSVDTQHHLMPYVFSYKKSSDIQKNKLYATIAAASRGVPYAHYYNLDTISASIPSDVILGLDTQHYAQKMQWISEGSSAASNTSAGLVVVEDDRYINMTTDALFESTCTTPVFVVNIGHQSPGMACQAYYYISKTGTNIFTYSGNTVNPLTSASQCKIGSPAVSGIPVLDGRTRWQRVAFPYASDSTQIQCVDASDAWIEGREFERFVHAIPSNVYQSNSMWSGYVSHDWSRCNPINANDRTKRNGPLKIGDKYMVLVEYPDTGFSDCSAVYTHM